MKKVGLLVLALVIALGALGVGYAKWSDTVTVNGTVTTGTVKIGIADVVTLDPTSANRITNPSYDPQFTGSGSPVVNGVTSDQKDVASHDSANNGTTLGSVCGTPLYKSVTESINNAYPWYAGQTQLKLGNLGTVPVKIDQVVFDYVSGNQALMNYMVVDAWSLMYQNESHVDLTVSGTGLTGATGLVTLVSSLQIPADTCAALTINFHFIEEVTCPDGDDADQLPDVVLMPQGVTGTNTLTFAINIIASQWNEVGNIQLVVD